VAYRLEVVDGIDGLGPFAEWNRLVASSPGASFFQSAEWISAWWYELANHPEVAVARVVDDGELVAGAALGRVRLPLLQRFGITLGAVVNAGSVVGAADHCGFPIATGATADALERLWEWARDWRERDPLVLANLGPDAPIAPLAAATLRPVGTERCPVAVIPPDTTFDAIRAGWTKNRRKTIGKKLRDFEAAGGRFEWIDDPEAVTALLPTLFELHRARREDLEQGSRFGHDVANRAFHERLARTSTPASGCWIQLATLDARPVGALYGFRFGDTYSVYQSGWEPKLHDTSLGLIQYAEAYRSVVERGGQVFDMCRGDDAYKLRFATEVRVESTYLRARGVSGRILDARYRVDARRRARRRGGSVDGEPVDDTEPLRDRLG
jgi:CelD/BcsL family acetyltransferase involved in cellulose biosynthesis